MRGTQLKTPFGFPYVSYIVTALLLPALRTWLRKPSVSFNATFRTCTINFMLLILPLTLATHKAQRKRPFSAMLSVPQLPFLNPLRQKPTKLEYERNDSFCKRRSRTPCAILGRVEGRWKAICGKGFGLTLAPQWGN